MRSQEGCAEKRFTKGESNAEELGGMALGKCFTIKQPGFTRLPFTSVLFLALNCDSLLYPSWSLLNSERLQRKNYVVFTLIQLIAKKVLKNF